MQTMWVHSIYYTVKLWKWTRFRKTEFENNLKLRTPTLRPAEKMQQSRKTTSYPLQSPSCNHTIPVPKQTKKHGHTSFEWKRKGKSASGLVLTEKITYSIFDNSNEWFSVTLEAHLNQETSKTITVQIPTGLWLSSAQHRVSTQFGVPSV